MKIKIWGKEVEINKSLVNEYKNYGYDFNEDVAKTFAYTSGSNENSTPKELKKAIEDGLLESIEVEKEMGNIIPGIERMIFND